MYDESAYHNIESEDSRSRLIKELTEEVNEQAIVITDLRKQVKAKYDIEDPNMDIPKDIKRISGVISHLTKWMKLSRDAGVKARIGTSISSLMKQKNVMVLQVNGLEEALDKIKKSDRKDHRYN